jgi:hypothetical protein
MAKGGKTATLVASAARTASGTGTASCGFERYEKFVFLLDVTAASGTNPTLDVTIQHSIDGGTNWHTLVAMTQATAAGESIKTESEVESGTAEVYGDCFRAIWTIGGTDTPTFTFKVVATAQES